MLNIASPVAGRRSRYPWLDGLLGESRPSVGGLMALCEENYASLLRLAPGLRSMQGDHRSMCRGATDLHLEIIEQSRYTTLLRLTYFFPHDDGRVHRLPLADPDALLRAYHDAAQVEVLDLRQSALPLHNHYSPPALDAKWKANLFFAKWIGYCQVSGHGFGGRESSSGPGAGGDR